MIVSRSRARRRQRASLARRAAAEGRARARCRTRRARSHPASARASAVRHAPRPAARTARRRASRRRSAAVAAPPRICSGAAYSGVMSAHPGPRARRVAVGARVEQLRDAEVEQLHLAGRASTRMFDGLRSRCTTRLLVRVLRPPRRRRGRGASRCSDREPARVAVRVERLALDVLHREPGRARRRRCRRRAAGRCAGARAGRGCAARARKRSAATRRESSAPLEQLERDALLELAVVALGEVDGAHARRARARGRSGTDRRARRGSASASRRASRASSAQRRRTAVCEEVARALVRRRAAARPPLAQRGVAAARSGEERRALVRRAGRAPHRRARRSGGSARRRASIRHLAAASRGRGVHRDRVELVEQPAPRLRPVALRGAERRCRAPRRSPPPCSRRRSGTPPRAPGARRARASRSSASSSATSELGARPRPRAPTLVERDALTRAAALPARARRAWSTRSGASRARRRAKKCAAVVASRARVWSRAGGRPRGRARSWSSVWPARSRRSCATREAPQLLVDEREQPVERVAVTRAAGTRRSVTLSRDSMRGRGSFRRRSARSRSEGHAASPERIPRGDGHRAGRHNMRACDTSGNTATGDKRPRPEP